jgi:branched-chain amino acid transport system substrate-binding protein
VRAELNRTKDYQSVVGPITFDDHRQNAVPIITKLVVQDGKWEVWEDSDYGKGKRKLPRP